MSIVDIRHSSSNSIGQTSEVAFVNTPTVAITEFGGEHFMEADSEPPINKTHFGEYQLSNRPRTAPLEKRIWVKKFFLF